jgi:hypothetical protein
MEVDQIDLQVYEVNQEDREVPLEDQDPYLEEIRFLIGDLNILNL